MRRAVDDEVAAAARRRLELLRAELGLDAQEQFHRDSEQRPGPDGSHAVTPSAAPAESGRHLRRKVSAAHLLAGWVADRLPATLRGRVALGPREMLLVALVGVLGVAVAAFVFLRSGPGRAGEVPVVGASTAPSVLLTPAGSSGPSASTGSGGAAAGPTTAAGKVVVDVAGKVRHPGVLKLPQGARVVDAIRKAGGARTGVDLGGLNLARVLTDGEQIVVGAGATVAPTGAAASAAGSTAPGPLVDINSATEEQLETLPGVGPVTAQKILAWRQAHGAFSSVDELLEVDGIGDKTLADLAPYVTL